MKHTLTNGEIYNLQRPFADLSRMELPIRTSYAIAKLAAVLNPHLLVIDKLEQGLVNKYGSKNNELDGQVTIQPGQENYEAFKEERTVLFDEKVEVDFDVVKIPSEVTLTCSRCKNTMSTPLSIKPAILIALDRFVTFEDPEPKKKKKLKKINQGRKPK